MSLMPLTPKERAEKELLGHPEELESLENDAIRKLGEERLLSFDPKLSVGIDETQRCYHGIPFEKVCKECGEFTK